MIDTKLLTEENGFVEGCVVEIDGEHHHCTGYFQGMKFEENFRHWDEWSLKIDGKFYSWEGIDSIRPLTGPMAIWNFAPEWANYKKGISWYQEPEESDLYSPVWESYYQKRPFWAKRSIV